MAVDVRVVPPTDSQCTNYRPILYS